MSMTTTAKATPGGVSDRQFDENGLVLPRKLVNPNIDDRQKKEVHREMLWKLKYGPPDDPKNCELAKAYNKFATRAQVKAAGQEASGSLQFEKMLEEQRQRLNSIHGGGGQQSNQQPPAGENETSESAFNAPVLIEAATGANAELARVFRKVKAKTIACASSAATPSN